MIKIEIYKLGQLKRYLYVDTLKEVDFSALTQLYLSKGFIVKIFMHDV